MDPLWLPLWVGKLRKIVPADKVSWFVHAGNGLAVCAMGCDDMLPLRSFLIGSTVANMLFASLQPVALLPQISWGCFFIAGHSIQIARILADQSDVTMSEREHDLYEQSFLPHGFSPRQFLEVIREADASWIDVAPGETLAEQGAPIEHLHLVIGGGGGGSAVVEQASEHAAEHPSGDASRLRASPEARARITSLIRQPARRTGRRRVRRAARRDGHASPHRLPLSCGRPATAQPRLRVPV